MDQADLQGQLTQLMQSPDMAEALALLQRIMAQTDESAGMAMDGVGEMAADMPGDMTGDDPGAAMMQPGTIESDVLDALSPQQRAALYRLPPHWREPMLEALHAPGPEGYQPLIDAYFRALSEQVP